MKTKSESQQLFDTAVQTLEMLQETSVHQTYQHILKETKNGKEPLSESTREKNRRFLLQYRRIQVGLEIIALGRLQEEEINKLEMIVHPELNKN